jgi:hypothetical protein
VIAETAPEILAMDLLRRVVHLSEACLGRMRTDEEAAGVRDFVEDCQIGLPLLEEDEIRERCVPRLQEFRSFVLWNLADADPSRRSEEEMAGTLQGAMAALPEAGREELESLIRTADEMLRENPGLYAAHKAKLVGTLVRELRFGEQPEPGEYEQLYRDLLSFGQHEERDRIADEARASGADFNSLELAGIDRDLVHIPFLRAAALGDYETVEELAREYAAAYPDSYVGYYYLAESAWQAGYRSDAVAIFRQGLGGRISATAALELFEALQARPPLDRVYEISLD